jgi:hypothetical protein
MADEAAEFWSAFEKETGEKVAARGMGEYFKSEGDGSGIWGLVVLTDKSFRFKHMPSENWLSSLFRRVDKSSGPKAPVEITIPLGDIISLDAPKRSLMARLFGPAFPRFNVQGKEAKDAGEVKSFLFSVDPSSGFLTALEKAANLAKESGATG